MFYLKKEVEKSELAKMKAFALLRETCSGLVTTVPLGQGSAPAPSPPCTAPHSTRFPSKVTGHRWTGSRPQDRLHTQSLTLPE